MTKHLLVDLENLQPPAAAVAHWMGTEGKAWIFYGPHQHKLLPAFQALGDRVTLIPISRSGANALDFHLVFYLGYLAAGNPKSHFTVLAKDTGYDPAIDHARLLTFAVRRVTALRAAGAKSLAKSGQKVSPGKSNPSTKNAVTAKKNAVTTSPAEKRPAATKLAHVKAPAVSTKVKALTPPSAISPLQPTVRAEASGRAVALAQSSVAPTAAPSIKAKVAPTPAKKKSAMNPPIAVYRDVLADLRGPKRPRTLNALERHIQTKFGTSVAPEKVRAIIDHLKTADIIQLVDGRLKYLATASTVAHSDA